MDWDSKTQDKFKFIVSKIPVFHRHIAEVAVAKKAAENASSRASQRIEEQDVISAFFTDVPKPFYSMMIRLLDQNGFDYKKYGLPKDTK
jgi:hypothetical protein